MFVDTVAWIVFGGISIMFLISFGYLTWTIVRVKRGTATVDEHMFLLNAQLNNRPNVIVMWLVLWFIAGAWLFG